jgi:hypothetical protein
VEHALYKYDEWNKSYNGGTHLGPFARVGLENWLAEKTKRPVVNTTPTDVLPHPLPKPHTVAIEDIAEFITQFAKDHPHLFSCSGEPGTFRTKLLQMSNKQRRKLVNKTLDNLMK